MANNLAKLVLLLARFIKYLSRIESPRSKRSWRMGIGQLIGAVLVGSAIGYAVVKHTFIAQAERARIEDETSSLVLRVPL